MTVKPDAVALLQLLCDLKTTLEHARIFITTREKMHPEGVALYDQDIAKIVETAARVEWFSKFESTISANSLAADEAHRIGVRNAEDDPHPDCSRRVGKAIQQAILALPITPQDGVTDFWEAVTPTQREKLFASLHSLTCNPCLDEIPLVMQEVAAILLAERARK